MWTRSRAKVTASLKGAFDQQSVGSDKSLAVFVYRMRAPINLQTQCEQHIVVLGHTVIEPFQSVRHLLLESILVCNDLYKVALISGCTQQAPKLYGEPYGGRVPYVLSTYPAVYCNNNLFTRTYSYCMSTYCTSSSSLLVLVRF